MRKTISILIFSTALVFGSGLVSASNGGAQTAAGSSDVSSSPAASPAPVVAESPASVPALTGAPDATPAPAETAPAVSFIEKIWAFLQSTGGFLAGAVVVFEFFVRAFPTKNPLSILVPVKHFIDVTILILGFVSNFLVSLINAANKSETKVEKKEVKL